jgi:hypothetical protein
VMLAVVAVKTNIQFLLMDMVAIIITECLYFLWDKSGKNQCNCCHVQGDCSIVEKRVCDGTVAKVSGQYVGKEC